VLGYARPREQRYSPISGSDNSCQTNRKSRVTKSEPLFSLHSNAREFTFCPPWSFVRIAPTCCTMLHVCMCMCVVEFSIDMIYYHIQSFMHKSKEGRKAHWFFTTTSQFLRLLITESWSRRLEVLNKWDLNTSLTGAAPSLEWFSPYHMAHTAL